jgi:hypothetical protein
MWKKNSQSLHVHSISDVRQIEIHAAEQIVPASSPLNWYCKVKGIQTPGYEQMLANLNQTGGETLLHH